MKFTRTLASGATLALFVGSLAPAVYAAPSQQFSCTEIENEFGITYNASCGSDSLVDLEFTDTVTQLRVVPKTGSAINDLRLLSNYQNVNELEIYGATEEAITAALSMPNLRGLQLNFPDGTILSNKAKDELAQLQQLDMLQLTETAIRDFRWVTQLTTLKNFYSYDQRDLPEVQAGSTITFEPFIGVNGKADVPSNPAWSDDDLVGFTSITSTSALAQSGGERRLDFGTSEIPAGSSLEYLGIGSSYTVGINDVATGFSLSIWNTTSIVGTVSIKTSPWSGIT